MKFSNGELAQMEQAVKSRAENSDRCVCCGAYVPEGRMVCTQCEKNEYKSPVSVMISDMATKLEKTQEGIIIKAIQDVDVKVDKYALIKAIETDRKYQEGKLIEVVRCKDCKHWNDKKRMCECPEWTDMDGWHKATDAEDYCFRADRKEKR